MNDNFLDITVDQWMAELAKYGIGEDNVPKHAGKGPLSLLPGPEPWPDVPADDEPMEEWKPTLRNVEPWPCRPQT